MSLSPDQHRGEVSQGSPGSAAHGGDKSVLSSLNLNFFKSLSEKKATRDANPPKRRGPKPDSKPALTRRQELNRQAQRTHRERKELYIKALEDEVLRLKEVFSTVSQDKQHLIDENRQLRDLLSRSGLQYLGAGRGEDGTSNRGRALTSTASTSGRSYGPASHDGGGSPALKTESTAMSMSPVLDHPLHQHMMGSGQMRSGPRCPANGGSMVDLEQAGIDFVLTLERPCMAHLPFLLDRTKDAGEGLCGHVLMASCPSVPFDDLTADVPFQNGPRHDIGGQCPAQGTWTINKADLATLLDLSSKLDLDGEITPVMAWGMVLSHPRAAELGTADFEKVAEELLSKVRCYGFGAVIEEFELRDAMESVLSDRADAMEC